MHHILHLYSGRGKKVGIWVSRLELYLATESTVCCDCIFMIQTAGKMTCLQIFICKSKTVSGLQSNSPVFLVSVMKFAEKPSSMRMDICLQVTVAISAIGSLNSIFSLRSRLWGFLPCSSSTSEINFVSRPASLKTDLIMVACKKTNPMINDLPLEQIRFHSSTKHHLFGQELLFSTFFCEAEQP